jgi:hypothetical protein
LKTALFVTNGLYTVLNGNLLECGGGKSKEVEGYYEDERRRRVFVRFQFLTAVSMKFKSLLRCSSV